MTCSREHQVRFAEKVMDARTDGDFPRQIGDRLRAARERRRLTLEDATRCIGVLVGDLEALERGRLDALPGPAFARELLEAYAGSLGFEGKEFAGEVFPPERRRGPLFRRLGSHPRAIAAAFGATTVVVATLVVAMTFSAPNNAAVSWMQNFLHELSPGLFLGSEPQRVVVLSSARPGAPGEGSVMAVRVASDGWGVLYIPRNTLVEVPGHGSQAIGETAALGGGELTRRTVAHLTGLEVPHYFVVSAEGVREIVDAAGGVEVEVPDRIRGRASIGGPELELRPGRQVLDGDEALVYLQGRDLSSDVERAERQRAFLSAMLGQALSLRNLAVNPASVGAVSRHARTNMSAVEAMQLAARLRVLSDSGLAAESGIMPGRKGPEGQRLPDPDALPDAVARTLH